MTAVDPAMLGAVGAALATVRKSKSEAKLSMRAEVARIVARGARGAARPRACRRGRPARGGQDHRHARLRRGAAWTASDVELIPVEKPKPQG